MCDAAPPHTPSALSSWRAVCGGLDAQWVASPGCHPGVHSLLDLTETKNEGLQHRNGDVGVLQEERLERLGGNLQSPDGLHRPHSGHSFVRCEWGHLAGEIAGQPLETSPDIHLRLTSSTMNMPSRVSPSWTITSPASKERLDRSRARRSISLLLSPSDRLLRRRAS